jgi:hypothetical protein
MSFYKNKNCKFYIITKSTKNPARKTIDQLDKNSNGKVLAIFQEQYYM